MIVKVLENGIPEEDMESITGTGSCFVDFCHPLCGKTFGLCC